jgi:hypothetical protein
MATQTLRGMDNHGPMHWRGDRVNQSDPGDEDGAFKEFNGAFVGLLGRSTQLTAQEMQDFTNFVLQMTMPPNPIRNLDDFLNPDQQAGRDFYFDVPNSDGVTSCNGCHVLAPPTFFGTNGNYSFEAEPQHFKIPQLRNMYEKVGMFGMANVPFFNDGNNGDQGEQIRGFGFLHDGSVDTLFRFHDAALFNFGSGPQADVLRAQVEQFMFAFDTNLKPVVGQQITVDDGNPGVAGLIYALADSGHADIVAKVVVNGEVRGYYLTDVLEGSAFVSDKSSEPSTGFGDLAMLSTVPGQEVTFTAVPLGSGYRIGVDRDDDGWMNRDDNCPMVFNPQQFDDDNDGIGNECDTDLDDDGVEDSIDNCPGIANPLQEDTDNDSEGDACDLDDDGDSLSDVYELSIGTNPLLADTDGDGMGDNLEVGYDGDFPTYTPGADLDPNNPDTDGDGVEDGTDVEPLTFNVAGDVAPKGAPDGIVNAADMLVQTQFALGLLTPSAIELQNGDLYPAGAPDGTINTSDMMLMMKLVLP